MLAGSYFRLASLIFEFALCSYNCTIFESDHSSPIYEVYCKQYRSCNKFQQYYFEGYLSPMKCAANNAILVICYNSNPFSLIQHVAVRIVTTLVMCYGSTPLLSHPTFRGKSCVVQCPFQTRKRKI